MKGPPRDRSSVMNRLRSALVRVDSELLDGKKFAKMFHSNAVPARPIASLPRVLRKECFIAPANTEEGVGLGPREVVQVGVAGEMLAETREKRACVRVAHAPDSAAIVRE